MVEVDENLTPREVALRVYRILMGGIGADGGTRRPLLSTKSDELFGASDEDTE